MAERPDLTILEISLEAGYRSKASFNEQFGKIVGMSPSEYRRSLNR
jgi:AraC-like DNA-binding protein